MDNTAKTRLHIVQVVHHLRPGGLEMMALDLHRFIEKIGAIQTISLEGSKAELIQNWPKLAAFREGFQAFAKPAGVSPLTLIRLIRFFRKTRPDVVHTHHIGPLLYGGLAARIVGIPVVHTEHDAWFLNDPKQRRLEGILLKIIRPNLVADADHVARYFKGFFPQVDPLVIKNGIDTSRFNPGNQQQARQRLGLPHDAWIIGCAARLEAVKGHSLLLEAFSQAFANMNVHLVLAGRGSLEQALRQQSSTAGSTARVHFLNHVEEMPTFYRAINLFCLPSLAEGMPLSPLEAQACGTSVLVTDAGGAAETVCPDTGKIVAAGDVSMLTKALRAAFHNPVSGNPRTFVLHNANVEHMGHNYAKLYFSLVKV